MLSPLCGSYSERESYGSTVKSPITSLHQRPYILSGQEEATGIVVMPVLPTDQKEDCYIIPFPWIGLQWRLWVGGKEGKEGKEGRESPLQLHHHIHLYFPNEDTWGSLLKGVTRWKGRVVSSPF